MCEPRPSPGTASFCGEEGSWHARTSAFCAFLFCSRFLQWVLENELSTTPDSSNGEPHFTITHPFHPLFGQSFPLLSQRVAWGEERVFFSDPQTKEIRSLPLAWTDLAPPDPFLVVAAGKAVLRLQDLQQLAQFLKQKPTYAQEDR